MNRSIYLAFTIVLIVLNGQTFASLKQGYAIKGKLLCGPLPVATNSTKLRLVDIDFGIDPDDTLDEKTLKDTNEFSLKGFTSEFTPIDPVLYIWTKCNTAKPCHRKIKFVLPKDFIIKDEKETNWFQFGTINLQSVFDKEAEECL